MPRSTKSTSMRTKSIMKDYIVRDKGKYNHVAMDGGRYYIDPTQVGQILYHLLAEDSCVSIGLVPHFEANQLSTLFFDIDTLQDGHTGQYIIGSMHDIITKMYGETLTDRMCAEKNESKLKYHLIYPAITVSAQKRKLITQAMNVLFGYIAIDEGCSALRYPGFLKYKKPKGQTKGSWKQRTRYLPYDYVTDQVCDLTEDYMKSWNLFGARKETASGIDLTEAISRFKRENNLEVDRIEDANYTDSAVNSQAATDANAAQHQLSQLGNDFQAFLGGVKFNTYDEDIHGQDFASIEDVKKHYANNTELSNVMAQCQSIHARKEDIEHSLAHNVPTEQAVQNGESEAWINGKENCDNLFKFLVEHKNQRAFQLVIGRGITQIKRVGTSSFYMYSDSGQCDIANRCHRNSRIYYTYFASSGILYQFCRSCHCAKKYVTMYAPTDKRQNLCTDYKIAEMFANVFPNVFVWNKADEKTSSGRWYVRRGDKYYSCRNAEKTLRNTISGPFVNVMSVYFKAQRQYLASNDVKAANSFEKFVMAFTQKCQNVKSVNSILTALRDKTCEAKSTLKSDNPDLVVFKEGIFDMMLGTIRALKPDEFITDDKLMGVEFEAKENIEPKRFKKIKKFLKRIFPDKATRVSFLQHMAVACTQRTLKRIALNHGGTNNGKSCWNAIMEAMLGGYAKALQESMIQQGSKGKDATMWVMTEGCRYVYVDEIDEAKALKVGELKKISGNKVLAGRMIYSTRTTFENYAKCFIYLNNLPRLDCSGPAAHGRFIIFHWPSQFVDPTNSMHPSVDTKNFIFKQDPYFASPKFHQDCGMPLMWLLSQHLQQLGQDSQPSISALSHAHTERFLLGSTWTGKFITFFDRNYKKITTAGWDKLPWIRTLDIVKAFQKSEFFPHGDPDPVLANDPHLCKTIKTILSQHVDKERYSLARKRFRPCEKQISAPLMGYVYEPKIGTIGNMSQPLPSELHANYTQEPASDVDDPDCDMASNYNEQDVEVVDQQHDNHSIVDNYLELEDFDWEAACTEYDQNIDAIYGKSGAGYGETQTHSLSTVTCGSSLVSGPSSKRGDHSVYGQHPDNVSEIAPSTVISATVFNAKCKRPTGRSHSVRIMKELLDTDDAIKAALQHDADCLLHDEEYAAAKLKELANDKTWAMKIKQLTAKFTFFDGVQQSAKDDNDNISDKRNVFDDYNLFAPARKRRRVMANKENENEGDEGDKEDDYTPGETTNNSACIN